MNIGYDLAAAVSGGRGRGGGNARAGRSAGPR
jgi:hypothetical protein